MRLSLDKNSDQSTLPQESPDQGNLPENSMSSNLSNSTYRTYTDNDNGFSIQYPSDWISGFHNPEMGTVKAFSPGHGIDASVDVHVISKSNFNTIKEYGDRIKETVSDVGTLLSYYRNSSTLLNGKSAFKTVYITKTNPSFADNLKGIESQPVKSLLIATMIPEKNSIYSIGYNADPSIYDKYLPVVEKMIDSFQINNKGPVIQEDNSSSTPP